MRCVAPLVGRQAEFGALEAALDFVAADAHGAIAFLSGEAGSGKTRLLEELARTERARMVWGQCVATTEDLPLAPWTQVLRALGVDVQPEPGTAFVDLVATTLRDLAANGPAVCVLEDAQWIDDSSRDVLLALSAQLRALPLLIVTTFRPEDTNVERRDAFATVTHNRINIDLSSLDPEAARDLASAVTRTARDAEAVTDIVDRADGNPLFIAELAAAPAGHVPETLRGAFTARIHALSSAARRLIEVASVMGSVLPRAWLARACAMDEPDLRAAAREAVERGVLVAGTDDRSYRFRHGMVQECVREDLLPDERVAMHVAIARALSEDPAVGRDIDRTAALAYHWNAAECPAEALHWSVLAAREASDGDRHEAARDFYIQVLSWWDAVPAAADVVADSHVSVLFAAADACCEAGNLEQAADFAEQALHESADEDPRLCVDGFTRALRHLWAAHRNDELETFATIAREYMHEVGDATRARFLIGFLSHLMTAGRREEIAEIIPLLRATAEATHDPQLQCDSYAEIAAASELSADLQLGEESYDVAATIARAHGLFDSLGLILYNRAAVFIGRGDHASCFRWLDELDAAIEAHGLRRMLVPGQTLRAGELCITGRLADAEAAVETVDASAADGIERHVCDLTRALIALHRGDDAAVRARLESHRSLSVASVDLPRYLYSSLLRASALLGQGDVARARAVTSDAFDSLGNSTEDHFHGWLATVAARVEVEHAKQDAENPLARLNAIEEITVIRDRFAAGLRKLVAPVPLLDAYLLAIDAELARLTQADVAGPAAAAGAAFDALQMPYFVVYFQLRTTEALLLAGDRSAATAVLKSARATATRLGYEGLTADIVHLARTNQLRLGGGAVSVDGDAALSERELEVLQLLVEGKSNPQIGEALFVTASTAKAHVSKILEKLGASSRTEAVAIAQRRGIL
jgi:DNA-binding CsgD family transcriptional regulator